MDIQRRDNFANGKEFEFNKDADFIPFDFDEDNQDEHEEQVTIINGQGRKRKHDDIESSPEQGLPPLQRQKLAGVNVNPWQRDIDEYASCNETAKLYKPSTAGTNFRLHLEVQDFTKWIYPTTKEHQVREFVVKRVVDTIESAVPQCRAFAFGSFSTKLYVPFAYNLNF